MDKQKSIDILNKAAADEILSINQYIYYHFHCENRGLSPLSAMFMRISIVEMKHLEEIAERILFLGGDLKFVPAGPVIPVKGVKDSEKIEDMLTNSKVLEQEAIDAYNQYARMASENFDSGTKNLFDKLVPTEEEHWDIFDKELQNFENFGDEYVSLQAMQSAKNETKKL